ncbi:MAG: glutamate ABC transporter substrate-binding protein [Microbacteriaceae bacterium]
MKKSLSIAAIAIASVMTLAACSSGGTEPTTDPTTTTPAAEFPAGSTMEKLAKSGEMTLGTKFDQPLFGLKGPSGDPEGFDVEIAKIIADELGVKIKYVETVSKNREPFIENGTVDIVIATYTINDKRKEVVSFAGPYYIAGQDSLVLANNTTIKGEADLIGKPVCSATGSTPAKKLEEIGATPVLFDKYTDCLEPLRAGTVVAVSTDNVILAGLAAQNPGDFKVVGSLFTVENYGIGLKHDDTEFRNWINDVLEKAEADGRYKAAWDKTVGTNLPYVNPPKVDRY